AVGAAQKRPGALRHGAVCPRGNHPPSRHSDSAGDARIDGEDARSARDPGRQARLRVACRVAARRRHGAAEAGRRVPAPHRRRSHRLEAIRSRQYPSNAVHLMRPLPVIISVSTDILRRFNCRAVISTPPMATRLAMTARALFRFTGPDKSQLACLDKGGAWVAQSHADFLATNGGDATAARLWDGLPYVPKPMDDFPEMEAALEKAREYLGEERPVRDRIAAYRSRGILADEAELLGRIADIHGRLASMYLAKAAKVFRQHHRSRETESPVAAAADDQDTDATDGNDLKG